MKLAPKPYKLSPYDDMVAKGAPWIAEVKERVLKRIGEFNECIRKEAEADGQPELASEDFLYDRFKINCEYGMIKGNMHILKYFLLYFTIKLLYDMIGEWKFTERDVELYNYYRLTNFYPSKRIRLTINPKAVDHMPSYFVHDSTCKWFIQYDDNGVKREIYYVDFFCKSYLMFYDIMHNIKNLPLLYPNNTFFDTTKFHDTFRLNENASYELLVDCKWDYIEKTAYKKRITETEDKELLKFIRFKNYRETHKNEIASRMKRYYAENKDHIDAINKVYKSSESGKELSRLKEKLPRYKKRNAERQKNRRKNGNTAKRTEYYKKYREEHYDEIKAREKRRRESPEYKSKRKEYKKQWEEANKEINKEKRKQWKANKLAAGYRRIKDPDTGKTRWVYIGIEK